MSEKAGAIPGGPGLYTASHVAKWKRIVDRVHAKGGKIIVQLWAAGWTNDGKSGIEVVSPGDIPQAPGRPKPRALTEEEIWEYIRDYTESAKLAMEAGFDGVELQARESKRICKTLMASDGYLINQFFSSASNNRTDKWGGSVANRARFALEIIKSTAAAIGAGRIGIRLAPYALFAGVYTDESPREHLEIIDLIRDQFPDFGYVHMVEPRGDPVRTLPSREFRHISTFLSGHTQLTYRPSWRDMQMNSPRMISAKRSSPFAKGCMGQISSSSVLAVTRSNWVNRLRKSMVGGVAYGRFFIASKSQVLRARLWRPTWWYLQLTISPSDPDLPRRIKHGWPLQKYDRPTFYTRGPTGYTDYPFFPHGERKSSAGTVRAQI